MHTFIHGDIIFNYNSDLSGDVAISYKGSQGEYLVDGDAILAFVAEFVRNRRISALEDASDAAILGIREEDMP